jgi:hypothetical protein
MMMSGLTGKSSLHLHLFVTWNADTKPKVATLCCCFRLKTLSNAASASAAAAMACACTYAWGTGSIIQHSSMRYKTRKQKSAEHAKDMRNATK